MRRRRRIVSDHDNHDRWLISYADFITLLFAFFVVMYAISAVNENKLRVLAGSLGDAFGKAPASETPVPQPTKQALPAEVRQRTLKQQQAVEEQAHMTEVASGLLDVMAPLVKEGKVRVTQSRRGVSIEINANVLFAPGRAELEAKSLAVLRAVAERLRNEPFKLEITGHTDVMPISNPVFASNWELSAVRATSVVRLLADNGIAPARLSAIGREASQPIAPNDTAEGRARNRRVELMILSGLPDTVEEIPVRPNQPRP
ncbi:flagellar motor protein MotD [Thiobacillus sp. 65-1402]|uniref:flagellar motor protein MotD n=1 Tax=Thiobacillus sp. 65-1402 TaxID=1895861 RepID=UPI0009675D47|nr:flagellar motor protein MotD [Thiobacillus sp. 65-1402]OJW88470.1 MAG: flagellar motor protein MotD [Thiobacillus sp. 65-1402]